MPAHDAVTIVKDMTYRGKKEEWSNTYTLTGTTPTTDAAWKTLYDAIIASEKTCYGPDTRVVRAYGYVAGQDHAIHSWDYLGQNQTVAGTWVRSTHSKWAGDQAAWLRMRIGTTDSGKPRYVRKYFHDGGGDATFPDTMASTLRTAYVAHGNKMVDGTLPGGMKWCGPGQAIGTQPAASMYVTTRTLKRRGRRPTPAP
jgi:hypothetical protein